MKRKYFAILIVILAGLLAVWIWPRPVQLPEQTTSVRIFRASDALGETASWADDAQWQETILQALTGLRRQNDIWQRSRNIPSGIGGVPEEEIVTIQLQATDGTQQEYNFLLTPSYMGTTNKNHGKYQKLVDGDVAVDEVCAMLKEKIAADAGS